MNDGLVGWWLGGLVCLALANTIDTSWWSLISWSVGCFLGYLISSLIFRTFGD